MRKTLAFLHEQRCAEERDDGWSYYGRIKLPMLTRNFFHAGTLVMPTGSDVPSFFSSPAKRTKMLYGRLDKRFRDFIRYAFSNLRRGDSCS